MKRTLIGMGCLFLLSVALLIFWEPNPPVPIPPHTPLPMPPSTPESMPSTTATPEPLYVQIGDNQIPIDSDWLALRTFQEFEDAIAALPHLQKLEFLMIHGGESQKYLHENHDYSRERSGGIVLLYASPLFELLPVLSNLRELRIHSVPLDNISLAIIARATQVIDIGFHSNDLHDISPLASMTNLIGFSSMYNPIANLTPLAGLTNIRWLSVTYGQISDVSPLGNLIALERLGLENNQISDVSSLAALINLRILNIWNNPIDDFASLAHLTELVFQYNFPNPRACY
ncbi:MAG: leucine-rich repeat domain-containing protein [Oscillospiraceae bacterium]|nr:leucine-rich repeat domain-containing protein [Oscillospiraceae bacterium]